MPHIQAFFWLCDTINAWIFIMRTNLLSCDNNAHVRCFDICDYIVHARCAQTHFHATVTHTCLRSGMIFDISICLGFHQHMSRVSWHLYIRRDPNFSPKLCEIGELLFSIYCEQPKKWCTFQYKKRVPISKLQHVTFCISCT